MTVMVSIALTIPSDVSDFYRFAFNTRQAIAIFKDYLNLRTLLVLQYLNLSLSKPCLRFQKVSKL